jgi:hypothetical protein
LVHKSQWKDSEAEKKIIMKDNKGSKETMIKIHTQKMIKVRKVSMTANIKAKQ